MDANRPTAHQPSLSLSPAAAKNLLNEVSGNVYKPAGGGRSRAPPTARKQGTIFNSFSTSRKSTADRRNSDAIGFGKKVRQSQFRRRSCEDDHDEFEDMPCSVSSFQQVFQQIKAKNPTASYLAVQQMTIRQISEMQRIKMEESDHLCGAANEDDEGKVGLVASISKFVGAMKLPDEADGRFNRVGSDRSCGLLRRLGSQESITSDFNSSSESLFKARTASEMYAMAAETQGANLAPRRSVCDSSRKLIKGYQSRDSITSELNSLFSEDLIQIGRDDGTENEDDNSDNGSTEDETQKADNSKIRFSLNDDELKIEFDEGMDVLASSEEQLKEDNHNQRKSRLSAISVTSNCSSICEDGLIVGFRPRCEIKVDEDDHMDSFASDFSAWEK